MSHRPLTNTSSLKIAAAYCTLSQTKKPSGVEGPKLDTYTRRVFGPTSCEQEGRKKVQLVKQEDYTAMAAGTMSYDASVYNNTNRLLIFKREGKKVTMQWANIARSTLQYCWLRYVQYKIFALYTTVHVLYIINIIYKY